MSPSWVRTAAVLLAVTGLAACASVAPAEPVPTPSSVTIQVPSPTERPYLPSRSAVDGPSALPGWDHEDHLGAFRAYVAGCGATRDPAGRRLCDRARQLARGRVTPTDARNFFETGFSVVPARTADGAPGLMTAYFAPEYPARRVPDREFDTPVLSKPDDLVRSGAATLQRRADGTTAPYPDRAMIEAGPPPGRVLGWMRAEDLFFMQIQGSGYLTFADGGRMRAAYAADNGRPFTGIARPMTEQGLLPRNGTSGEAIRGWLAAHRGAEARRVTALNPRYIFFAGQDDDGGHPAGAAGIPLPPRRAIAVDPGHWAYGDLVWISADGGNLAGARASYQGLVVALDTGSAIRGPVRADFYMGRGPAAGEEAGTVRHPLRMWRLVPRVGD